VLAAELKAACAFVRLRAAGSPQIGVVLGSGMSDALRLRRAVDIAAASIPHFPSVGVAGHRGVLSIGTLGRRTVAVLRGRVHYYEGHAPDRVVFGVRLLRLLGARALILTNAAGGIRRSLRPGSLMLVRDHLNLMGMNPLRGPNLDALGPRFPDVSALYDVSAARRAGLRLPAGVLAAVSGPSYETPAEVRMLRRLGADAVGMSVAPEALAAAHTGMRVVAVTLITNRAAGIGPRPLSHDEVVRASARARAKLERALSALVASL
jgi:purine-nucleoside phosphorylase